jgi:hypothetical protein
METTISKQQLVGASQKSHTSTTRTVETSFWQKAEFNRYSIISMLLLFIGCLGGFAASYGAGANEFKISLIVFPTIMSLAFILAVMPMRLIVWACSIAVLIDVALLIFQ